MEIERVTVDEQLLRHAARQTKALENIQSAVMLLLALAIVAAVVGLAFVVKG